jgi:V/A-type H+-transporting ATPase subunit I
MLVPMAKVELIGPKNRFYDVVSLLHDLGTLHIEDLSKKIQSGEVPLDKMEVVENQAAEKERMEDLLLRLRSIVKALHLPSTTVDELEREKQYLQLWSMDSRELSQEVTDVIEQVEDRTSSLAQAQANMEAEIALLGRYEPILHKIQPLAKQIVTTGTYDSVALLVERRYKGALEELKKELDEITKSQCEIVSTDVDDETTAVIVVFARKYSDGVHKFLAMENVNQVRLPSEFQDMPFDIAYDHLKERRSTLPKRLEEVRAELNDMSAKWFVKLSTIRDVLSDKIDEISAIPKFGQTEYAFVITGWLPVEQVKPLRRTIIEAFGTDVIVNQVEIDEHEYEETPVALKNPKFSAPYQGLMANLKGGLPMYGTIDPTTILAVTYPLIFGMIVGDIGYGSVMLAVILVLRAKYKDNPGVQMATSILGPAATMAIVVGFFYGEFFGDTLLRLGWIKFIPNVPLFKTLPYDRAIDIKPLMFLALGAGVVQIMYGLVLGVINAVRTKHTKHAFLKSGLIGLIAGAMIIISGFLIVGDMSPILKAAGGLVLGAGVLTALWFGKIMGFIEILETVSNIASYIRIMAVGVAGAIFANAINSLVVQMGWLVGGIIGLLLHTLNILICAFSPNVHALRLNFLEFFGKFYEASKSEYSPFHKTGGEKSA